MRLILIRHGQTRANVEHLLDTAHPGEPLTEHGHAQARALVDAIAHEEIQGLYASTLTRAQQTAEPLAARRGLATNVIDGIQEIAAGVEEMSPNWRTYVAMLASWTLENMDAKLPGGESAREFLGRFDSAVARIEAAGHERAALVSHGAALRVWALYRDLAFPHADAFPLDNTQWIVMNGSMASGWAIESWADRVVGVNA